MPCASSGLVRRHQPGGHPRPDCFIIESRLRELMDIPVFHDDQHGTAIIALAGLMNALHLTGRDFRTTQARLQRRRRARHRLCRADQGVGMPARTSSSATPRARLQGPPGGMNQWKSAHAVDTEARSLAEAMRGADVVFGPVAEGDADAAT
jgi:malate dehydrogenase (oxaloacetate-decarboxylating)(NADP+)